MMSLVKSFFALAIVFLCCSFVLGWRSFKINFTSFPFEFNSDYVDTKIEIQNNSVGDSVINVAVNVLEDVDNVFLKTAIAIESETGNYTALVNRTINFCKFLKQRNSEPIIRAIYEDLLKHGNFIKACPVKKGLYTLHEYHIDEEILPSYIPETSFFVDIALEKDNKHFFKGRLHGNIDKSKGFNNLKMFSLG